MRAYQNGFEQSTDVGMGIFFAKYTDSRVTADVGIP